MDRVTILLIDDHELVRSMLRERLSIEPWLEVIGAVSTADEGLELALSLRPHIVLMDIDMPGLHPFDAARKLFKTVPNARIIILSGFCQDRYIAEALEIGVRGFVTKTESTDKVIEAIREVSQGGHWFSEEVRDRVVYDARGRGGQEPEAKTRKDTLTPRELEVLRYTAQGLPKKEIARRMSITYKTVEKHSSNLMEKLHLHDRVEITRYAIREGLVEA